MLCTQTRSFAVKHVETSNTLLLISPDVEVGMPEAQLQHNSIAMKLWLVSVVGTLHCRQHSRQCASKVRLGADACQAAT